jgi:hypothetical protein
MAPGHDTISALRMVTTKAAYGGGQFAVALHSIPGHASNREADNHFEPVKQIPR